MFTHSLHKRNLKTSSKLCFPDSFFGFLLRWGAPGLGFLCCLVAQEAHAGAADTSNCGAAAISAEQQAGLPPGLLRAIGQVETGRLVEATGRVEPWPWSTNMNGVDHIFSTKAEAVAWTEAQLASGYQSIDVGCFQINLKYHPFAFSSVDEAFDPASNARYASKFLNELHDRSGGWQIAAAQYHSSDPMLGTPYGQRVFSILGGASGFAPVMNVSAYQFPGDRGVGLLAQPAAFPQLAAVAHSIAFGIRIIVPSHGSSSVTGVASDGLRLNRHTQPVDLVDWRFGPARISSRRLPQVITPD